MYEGPFLKRFSTFLSIPNCWLMSIWIYETTFDLMCIVFMCTFGLIDANNKSVTKAFKERDGPTVVLNGRSGEEQPKSGSKLNSNDLVDLNVHQKVS